MNGHIFLKNYFLPFLINKFSLFFSDNIFSSQVSSGVHFWSRLILSWRRYPSYRNQSIDLQSKSGFYMLGTSVMKELIAYTFRTCRSWSLRNLGWWNLVFNTLRTTKAAYLSFKVYVNPLLPNAPFLVKTSPPWKLYLVKISEKLTVFWCFQWVEKGCIGNEWVNLVWKRPSSNLD